MDSRATKLRPKNKPLKKRLYVLVLLTALFSVATLFGQWHRYLELFSHFRLQYFLASVVSLIVVLLYRDYKFSILIACIVALNAYQVLPLYLSDSTPDKAVDTLEIKLLHSNVYLANRDYNRLIDVVKQEKPDIVVLQEVNSAWLRAFEVLHEDYPYRKLVPAEGSIGIALLSKIEINSTSIIYAKASGAPSILANLTSADKEFSVIATHPPPPVNQRLFQTRNNQLQHIASVAKKIEGPLVIIGDLNITMWSSDYKKFESKAKLRNARKGFGVIPTWPSFFPLAYIPIDHCLVSDDFQVTNIQRAENVGSDHYPLIVDLLL